MEKGYRYLGFFLPLLYPLTFFGFYRTYFNLYPDFKNVSGAHHFHGAVAFLWITLLIIQPFLISYKKVALHHLLGKASYFLFPVLIFSFLMMMYKQGLELKGLFVPAADMLLLIFFYSLAILNRKNTPIHMRFMIASALVFIDPTVARLIVIPVFGVSAIAFHIIFGIIYAILLALILHDRANNRSYKPYAVALAAFFVYQIGFDLVYFF